MATKKKSESSELAHAVDDIVEKVVDEVKKAAKKAEKAVEEAVVGAAHDVVGDRNTVIVEKKATKEKTEVTEKDAADDKKKKLAKLLEKAKKLEESVEDVKDVDLKKKVKPEEEEKKDTLVPMEDYLKSSIHLGTRVITPDMRPYVYRRRADGLAVFNTALLDDKMKEGAAYLAKFAPKDIIVVCKREAGWGAVNKFAQTCGIRSFTKKYPAGILTNTQLENFTEAELIFICDPWLDKIVLLEANKVGIPVLSICDTNNFTAGIEQIIPGNNKSAKSLGMIFYLLTKLYVEARGLKADVPPVQEFIENWDNLIPPK